MSAEHKPHSVPNDPGAWVTLDHFEELLRERDRLVEQYGALQHAIRALHNEVDCRIEHGAESGGHLEYVRTMLFSLMEDSNPAKTRLVGTEAWREHVERVSNQDTERS